MSSAVLEMRVYAFVDTLVCMCMLWTAARKFSLAAACRVMRVRVLILLSLYVMIPFVYVM